MNRRANRGRMGKSQKSAKPYGRATPNWIPQSGIHFSPSLSQAKDYPLINVRKILDTTSQAAQGVENCGETPGQIVIKLHAVAVTVVDKLHAVTGHPSYTLSF